MSAGTTPVRRPDGRRRRQAIIDATLRLIARDGVRAVRHRAVAAEAGVPVSATTYYFSDIGELLREAFISFSGERGAIVGGFRDEIVALVRRQGRDRQELGEVLAAALADYVLSQAGARDDRAIELAFRHEARRDASLLALSTAQERRFAADIEELLQLVGSDEPAADAQITLGVIYHLESDAAFAGLSEERVHGIVARHVAHMLRGPGPAPAPE